MSAPKNRNLSLTLPLSLVFNKVGLSALAQPRLTKGGHPYHEADCLTRRPISEELNFSKSVAKADCARNIRALSFAGVMKGEVDHRARIDTMIDV